MTTEDFDKIIDQLCTASDTQLDAGVFPALQRCKGNSSDREQQLLDILDCCAYSSLASPFVMKMLHFLYEQSGGSIEKRYNRQTGDIKLVFDRVFLKE